LNNTAEGEVEMEAEVDITGEVKINDFDTKAGGGTSGISLNIMDKSIIPNRIREYSDDFPASKIKHLATQMPNDNNIFSGIRPTMYATIFENSVQGLDADNRFYQSLHVNYGLLRFPEYPCSLNYYINTVISSKFANSIQADIKLITGPTLIETINAISYALQVYLFWQSISTYSAEFLINKNSGMIALQRVLTSEDLKNLMVLELQLLGTAIPPIVLLLVKSNL
jgi:hypothetical protein